MQIINLKIGYKMIPLHQIKEKKWNEFLQKTTCKWNIYWLNNGTLHQKQVWEKLCHHTMLFPTNKTTFLSLCACAWKQTCFSVFNKSINSPWMWMTFVSNSSKKVNLQKCLLKEVTKAPKDKKGFDRPARLLLPMCIFDVFPVLDVLLVFFHEVLINSQGFSSQKHADNLLISNFQTGTWQLHINTLIIALRYICSTCLLLLLNNVII